MGAAAARRLAWTVTWTSCGPGPTWTCSSAWTPGQACPPGPARTANAAQAMAARTGRAQAARKAGSPGQKAWTSRADPAAGVIPAGFAGRITLTIPLATLAGLADRPGEIPGLGPVDPWLARDLADAAARNPMTTWCVTVTDEHVHAIGHGWPTRTQEPQETRPTRAHRAGSGNGPRFSFTASGQPGPPDGYGTWRLRTGGGGPGLMVTLDPITTETCDHRFEAKGHNPSVKLRHLSQVRHATCTSPICRRPAGQLRLRAQCPV